LKDFLCLKILQAERNNVFKKVFIFEKKQFS